jgi:plasmid stability protein
MFLWDYGHMKTTLDLPDKLMREVKIRAAQDNRKLKDLVAELLTRALADDAAQERGRTKPPKPVRLRTEKPMTLSDIESAIAEGRA